MIEFDLIHSDIDNPTSFSREDIADFLYKHLDEYGDEKKHILSCIGFAYGDEEGQDGFILVAHEEEQVRINFSKNESTYEFNLVLDHRDLLISVDDEEVNPLF